jgi:hypothetical protein
MFPLLTDIGFETLMGKIKTKPKRVYNRKCHESRVRQRTHQAVNVAGGQGAMHTNQST